VKWAKVSDYHLRSECTLYTIAKVYVCGVVKYELWRGRERVGDWPTADEAKENVR
jgi:hypothetical protein